MVLAKLAFEPYDEDQYTVARIDINEKGYKGPRNIGVGDSAESVLSKFFCKERIAPGSGGYYMYGSEGTASFGYMTKNNNGIESIIYGYGRNMDGPEGTVALGFKVVEGFVETIQINYCSHSN